MYARKEIGTQKGFKPLTLRSPRLSAPSVLALYSTEATEKSLLRAVDPKDAGPRYPLGP